MKDKNYHTYLSRHLEPIWGQLLVRLPIEIDCSDPFLPFTCTFIFLVANLRSFGFGTCTESCFFFFFKYSTDCQVLEMSLWVLCVWLMNALINLLMRQVESHYMKVCPHENYLKYTIMRLHKQGMLGAKL